MKRSIIIFLVFLALSGCHKSAVPGHITKAPAANELAGIISKDTTISGTVRIVKDIYVSKGVTLTIAPGTTVIMVKSESTKVEPFFLSSNTEILVAGSIIAKGTADKKIKFVPEKKGTNMKDYAGIILLRSAGASFENCFFESAETAITSIESEVEIINSTFKECFYALSTVTSKVTIAGSVVTGCDKGFYFHKTTTGTVTTSEFSGCLEDGIFIDKRSSLDVSQNVFKDNLWGISTVEFRDRFTQNNEFTNNKVDVFQLNYD